MNKYTVRARIVTPLRVALHEDQVYEAETALDAMHAAQNDEKNTNRGGVRCQGADPFPAEPIIETKGERPVEDHEPPRRGRPPKHQVTPVE